MRGQRFSSRRERINIIAPVLWLSDRTVHAICARKRIDIASQPIPKPIGRRKIAKETFLNRSAHYSHVGNRSCELPMEIAAFVPHPFQNFSVCLLPGFVSNLVECILLPS